MTALASHAAIPGLVQSRDCTQAWGAFYLPNDNALLAGQTWSCRLAQGSQSGNAILVGFSYDPGFSLPTVTDDKSDTYTLVKNYNDSANGENLLLFLALNVTAGAQNVTINIGTGTGGPYINSWLAEFYNIATSGAVDCTSAGNHANSTTVTAGSCSPPTSGDLVVQYYWNDYTVATTAVTAGSQTNITWQLLAADYDTGIGVQWGVYNSTSALNPTMTTAPSGFASVAIFIKSASAGSDAAGMRVLAAKDVWLNGNATPAGGAPWNANTRIVPFPCPSASNLMYAPWIGGGAATLTGVTDSHSQTWTATGAGVVNDSYSHAFYVGNATVSPTQTITLTSTVNGGGDGTPILYCITGAATSPFDKTSTATGTQSSTSGTLSTVSITPSTPNGLVFVSCGNAFTTLTGLTNSGAWFHAGFESAENIALNGVNENNGWGSYSNPNTSAITFVFNEVDNTTAAGPWAARADAFKPAAGVVRRRAMVIQ